MQEKLIDCQKPNPFVTSFTVKELIGFFRDLIPVDTAGQLNDGRRRGVSVLEKGKFRMVRIVGPCPNYKNGKCVLSKCFKEPEK